MRCETREEEACSVVALSGEIDLSSSPRARQAILTSLGNDRPTVVDLSRVTYIDSSGVASLVEGYQTARNKGLKFCLVGVSEAAMSVLELARLDKVFPIYANVSECLGDAG